MTPAPEPVARIADLMASFRPNWSLCGGWAVDAWLGRETRDHGDMDVSVFQGDQRALFDHLAGWQLIAHDPNVPDNTSEPWNGRRLDLPAHIHGRSPEASRGLPYRLDDPAGAKFDLDIQLDDRDGGEWVLGREPRLSLPVDECVQQSSWGLPTAVPEILLFFKAKEPRPQDEQDFVALLPQLTAKQRNWLADAVSLLYPGHRWLTQLPP